MQKNPPNNGLRVLATPPCHNNDATVLPFAEDMIRFPENYVELIVTQMLHIFDQIHILTNLTKPTVDYFWHILT